MGRRGGRGVEYEESRGSWMNRGMNTRTKGKALREEKAVSQQVAEDYILVGDHAISAPQG